MNSPLDRVTLLALAALLEVADNATAEPMTHSLQVKALLWLLYKRSNRDRDTYARFWTTMTEEGRGPQAAYGRSTHAHTYWMGIARSVGAKPEPPAFASSLRSLVKEHVNEHSVEGRARRVLAAGVIRAGLDQEIVATKGNPRTAEARALMTQRLARGDLPDGSKPFG